MLIWSLGQEDPLRRAWQPIPVFSWATIRRLTELDKTEETHTIYASGYLWILNELNFFLSYGKWSVNSMGTNFWLFNFLFLFLFQCVLVAQLCPALFSLCTIAARLLCPWDFPDKNTGVYCHSRGSPQPRNWTLRSRDWTPLVVVNFLSFKLR